MTTKEASNILLLMLPGATTTQREALRMGAGVLLLRDTTTEQHELPFGIYECGHCGAVWEGKKDKCPVCGYKLEVADEQRRS